MKILLSASFIVTLFVILGGCDSQTPQTGEQREPQLQGLLNPKSAPWPFLSENDQTGIADNLLSSNIYIVFDGSGSMEQSACSGGEPKIVAAKRALLEFVKVVPDSANLGMVAFDRKGTGERTPLGIVDHTTAMRSIDDVAIGGGTPLSSAIEIAGVQCLRK